MQQLLDATFSNHKKNVPWVIRYLNSIAFVIASYDARETEWREKRPDDATLPTTIIFSAPVGGKFKRDKSKVAKHLNFSFSFSKDFAAMNEETTSIILSN